MIMLCDFLFACGLIGLPIFVIAVLVIWRPIPPDVESRPGVAVRMLSTSTTVLLCWLTVIGLPFLPYLLWRIWREPRRGPRPLADRVGWTVTSFGVALAAATAACFVLQEGKHARSPGTIRRQAWAFLAVATTPLAGPLTAFALQRREAGKGPADPLDAPIGPGSLD